MKGRYPSRSGVTLIDLLMLLSTTVIGACLLTVLLGNPFRGRRVREGSALFTRAAEECRQRAVRSHRPRYLILSSTGRNAWLEERGDLPLSGMTLQDGEDSAVRRIPLPLGVLFDHAPDWICFSPSGSMAFNSGFRPRSPSLFGHGIGLDSALEGDVILADLESPYRVCLTFNRARGKMRRSFFVDLGI